MAGYHFTPKEIESEEWRDIPNYEGIYQVSDLGRVKRLNKCKRAARPFCILKPNFSRGYPQVVLHKEKTNWYVTCHQLVLLVFVGPCPEGKETNHKDFNPSNSRLGNLEYLTHLENIHYSLERHARGETSGLTKFTKSDVHTIRQMVIDGQTDAAIARHFNVAKSSIRRIRNGTSWSHLPLSQPLPAEHKMGARKLSNEEVRTIRATYQFRKVTCKHLAVQFNVNKEAIRLLIAGKTYQDVL